MDDHGHAFPDWYDGDNCFNAADYEAFDDPEVVSRYVEYRRRCMNRPKTRATCGIIHGDLHFSNMIIDHAKGTATFCDLDDCCRGFFAMDLAMIVFDLGVILKCDKKAKVLAHLAEKIVDGYGRGIAESVAGEEAPGNAQDAAQGRMHGAAQVAAQGITRGAEPGPVALPLIEDYLKLLETSLYIQYRDLYLSHGGADGWLKLFFEGRRDRIVSDMPYITSC